ncbi:SH3 domain-containing protein 21 isoform X2 [Pleurodeles waltl]|uniref:SH3 domain-containing protein 21 isoform X2 n=1 Tax=Pleurodeles waltl TaxID=8319 RepID=UPI003709AD3A
MRRSVTPRTPSRRGSWGSKDSNLCLPLAQEIPPSLMGDGNNKYPRSLRKGKAKVPQRWCKVEFSYTPEKPDELELTSGEIVEVIQEIEDGWWLGKKGEKIGAFPSNFVQECKVPPAVQVLESSKNNKPRQRLEEATFCPNGQDKATTQENTSAKNNSKGTRKEFCKVMFDYLASNNDELSLKTGDIILVLRKETEDDGWWEGEFNGKTGMFPDNFVMLLSPVASLKSDKPPARKSTVKAAVKPDFAVPEKKPAEVTKPQNQVLKDQKVKPDFAVPEKKPAEVTKPQNQVLKDQKVKPDFTMPEKKPVEVIKSPIQTTKDQKGIKADMVTEKKVADGCKPQTAAMNNQKETKDTKNDSENKLAHPPLKKAAPAPPVPLKLKTSFKNSDRPDGNFLPKPVEPVKENTLETENGEFDALVVSSAKLSHPTSDRPKMAGKRPPTNHNHSPEKDEEIVKQKDPKVEEVEERPKSKAPSKVKEPQQASPWSPAPVRESAPTDPPQASPSQPQNKKTQPAKTSPGVPETKTKTEVELGDKVTLLDLKSEIQSLKVLMEALKTQYERDMRNINAELKEEKAKRMALQVEVERVKKHVPL